jgi:hypothetical protein
VTSGVFDVGVEEAGLRLGLRELLRSELGPDGLPLDDGRGRLELLDVASTRSLSASASARSSSVSCS